MTFIKRYAFWPLLVIGCATLTSLLFWSGHGTAGAWFTGVAVSVPIAAAIGHRRKVRGW